MRSRISFCNGTMLRRQLTRFAPLWAAFLGVWFVILPLSVFTGGAERFTRLVDLQEFILSSALYGGMLMGAIYAVMVAMTLFGYLYSPRSVNAFCSLPIRRGVLFSTNLTAAVLVWLVPSLLTGALTLVAAGVAGFSAFGLVGQWLAVTGMLYLFFLGLSFLCASLVGHLLALPVLYILLNFTAAVVNYTANAVLSTFVYGLSSNHQTMVLGKFSPLYYLLSRSSVRSVFPDGALEPVAYQFTRWSYVGILAGVGVLFLFCAYLLVRGRRMECAGDVVAVRCLRPVFKYCFTAGCSLILGVLAAVTLFSGRNQPQLVIMTCCLLAGGFVGYFGAEMLLKKTSRVFRREWIGYGVFAALLLCAVCAVEFDAFGYERYVPGVQDVAAVTLNYSGDAEVTDEAHIADILALHQGAVTCKAQQEEEARHNIEDGYDYANFTFSYRLKNGKMVYRSYNIYTTEAEWRDPTSLARQFSAVYNDPALITARNMPDFAVTASNISYASADTHNTDDVYDRLDFTDEEAAELYNTCVLPDMKEGLVGHTVLYRWDSEPLYTANVSFSFYPPTAANVGTQPAAQKESYYDIQPSEGSRTARWLETKGLTLTLQSEYDAAWNQEKGIVAESAVRE